MKFLSPFSSTDLSHYVSSRRGEHKIGENIQLIDTSINNTPGKFVIVGIPEDIGPKANLGKEGARFSWNAFLLKFLNMQANSLNRVNDVILAGKIEVSDLQHESTDLNTLRKEVEQLDIRVNSVIKEIVEAGKTPIVIGGGHNNCFPIISAFTKPIQVVNIDPHADIRKKEGRHSGNGFTYALETKILNRYFVLGLHEEYNSNYILTQFESNENLNYCSFNEILGEELSIKQQINKVENHLNHPKIGLEIDLDSIKNMPVSARTPIGFTEEEIRKIGIQLAKKFDFHYIHICEGAPLNEKEKTTVGKTIAYLVMDFIKYNS
jgi:formiminoglutamase